MQRSATNVNPGNSDLEPPGFVLVRCNLDNCVGDIPQLEPLTDSDSDPKLRALAAEVIKVPQP